MLDSYEEETAETADRTSVPYIGDGFHRTFINNTSSIVRILDDTMKQVHICEGAERISLWYRTLSNTTIQLGLYDNSKCIQSVSEECLQLHMSSLVALEPSDGDDADDWTEITWGFHSDDDWLNAPKMNLMHIHGYEVFFNASDSGVVDLDHLACYGGQKLFQSHLKVDVPIMPEEPDELNNWRITVHNSELASNETVASIDGNGVFKANYTVEKTESWGGYTVARAYFPGYYNFSAASFLSFDYVIHTPADPRYVVSLRLIVGEQFSATADNELFYSFHYILDDANDNTTASITIPLEGGPDQGTGFWYTGWSGSVNDRSYDKSRTKAFAWEVAIDGMAPDGIVAKGGFEITNVRLGMENTTSVSSSDKHCESELELTLTSEGWNQLTNFRIGVGDCCLECEKTTDCNFAIHSVRKNCATLPQIGPALSQELRLNSGGALDVTADVSSISLLSRESEDFCAICRCVERHSHIDCRGKHLLTIPQTFNHTWVPRSLDLRENPYLAIIGKESLKSISGGLVQIFFPSNLRYLAFAVVEQNPFLKSVDFEDFNVLNIKQTGGTFGDICCVEGAKVEAFQGGDHLRSLSFCNHQGANSIGADATFFPYQQFKFSYLIAELRTSSLFMPQAAENPEMCAEYCKLNSRCLFFQYDSRSSQSENTCAHYSQASQLIENQEYADEDLQTPGIVSGVAPRARGMFENARVIFSRSELQAHAGNDFTVSYEVRLGAMPQRGAVWIEPYCLSNDGLNVSLSPAKVALSDNMTIATFTATIADIQAIGNKGRTLVLKNNITTCDQAFSSDFLENSECHIRLNVAPIEDPPTGLPALLVVGIALLMVVITVLLWTLTTRRLEDHSWKVDRQDLKFSNPPIVLGRGTFGLVVLAEWR